MKRAIWSIVFVLLSAMVMNLAVAWGCAYWRLGIFADQMAVLDVDAGADTARQFATRSRRIGWTFYLFSDLRPDDDLIISWGDAFLTMPSATAAVALRTRILDVGWPVRCLRARQVSHRNPNWIPGNRPPDGEPQWFADPWEAATILGEPTGMPTIDYVVLPRGIMPRGMLINIAFWSIPGVMFIFLIATFKRSCKDV